MYSIYSKYNKYSKYSESVVGPRTLGITFLCRIRLPYLFYS